MTIVVIGALRVKMHFSMNIRECILKLCHIVVGIGK